MCGVVGLVYGTHNPALGKESAALLQRLEYRGYDSTGAAFFSEDGAVRLEKKVGAPSHVIRQLRLDRGEGVKFIGQVRWATFGAVTDHNSQPHEVRCRRHVVGAHNGNIANTDAIKEFLIDDGHSVASDNDGEMVVHEVEHYYDLLAAKHAPSTDAERIDTMIRAIRRAQRRLEGSYAACIAFPDLPGIFAMKSGSSLYAGKGSDEGGEFIVVSSDLTSVLSKTRYLIPLSEGQGIYFTHDSFRVFSLTEDREIPTKLTRSRLNIADIELQPRFDYFMHQEIHTAADGIDRILRYYFLDPSEAPLFALLEDHQAQCKEIIFELLRLYDIFEGDPLRQALAGLVASPGFSALVQQVDALGIPWPRLQVAEPFVSDEANLLNELLALDPANARPLWLLDRIVVWKKKRMVTRYRDELIARIRRCFRDGGRVFAIGAGTSHHATLVGATLFNSIAQLSIVPVNPGGFRSMYIDSLTEHDLIIGVTQSGETKDLLDIYNDVRARYGDAVGLVTLVNNELSTIPQEKSDFFLPILCGPEIAVAATKSFISQVALFHLLACMAVMEPAKARARIAQIKAVLQFTLQDVQQAIAEVALHLFMVPSLHILGTSQIGLAREGALKIREVVLNHTEGYDGAEFKHGPNTILGKNTIYGVDDLERLLVDVLELLPRLVALAGREQGEGATTVPELVELFQGIRFQDLPLDPDGAEQNGSAALREAVELYEQRVDLNRYFRNYPLIFLCPPEPRDIKITTTQIHTHKIRGADIILIAQDNDQLRRSVEGVPAGFDDYYHRYIRVPKMFGSDMYVYQAALTLQLLAFEMSVAKRKLLNRNRVENHGVHPDAPKNVSKSITVD